MTASLPPAPTRRKRPLLILVPLLLFGAMAVMFAFALTKGDPAKLPSALIGKPAPSLALTAIEGLQDGPRAVQCVDRRTQHRGSAPRDRPAGLRERRDQRVDPAHDPVVEGFAGLRCVAFRRFDEAGKAGGSIGMPVVAFGDQPSARGWLDLGERGQRYDEREAVGQRRVERLRAQVIVVERGVVVTG